MRGQSRTDPAALGHTREIECDRYEQTVAEFYSNSRSINLQLVKEGQAVVYRQYLDNCNKQQYLEAEKQAQQKRLVFWNQENPTMP